MRENSQNCIKERIMENLISEIGNKQTKQVS